MRVHPMFHISLLEKIGNSETTESIEADDEEYEGEKILAKRTKKDI